MALLFQSNPEQWDLRQYLKPGARGSWSANRFLSYMKRGTLTLLWESQGKEPKEVKGLYGWGILEAEPAKNMRGKQSVPIMYIERWVSTNDVEQRMSEHMAAISADEVFKLESWKEHLLAKMPIGANFRVEKKQLEELTGIIMKRYTKSDFQKAADMDETGGGLEIGQFVPGVIEEG